MKWRDLMRHKHYDMIVAKAANMDLVKFVKHTGSQWEIEGSMLEITAFHQEADYFLCLPQHKEACLHWLNGCDAQVMDDNWVNMFPVENYPWEEGHDFVDVEAKIRIKPKKEKRWIIATVSGGIPSLCGQQLHYSRETAVEFAELHGPTDKLQFIEIEVEV